MNADCKDLSADQGYWSGFVARLLLEGPPLEHPLVGARDVAVRIPLRHQMCDLAKPGAINTAPPPPGFVLKSAGEELQGKGRERQVIRNALLAIPNKQNLMPGSYRSS
jgi:hypothetical protein